jgi:hypothetical protein
MAKLWSSEELRLFPLGIAMFRTMAQASTNDGFANTFRNSSTFAKFENQCWTGIGIAVSRELERFLSIGIIFLLN